MHKYYINTKLPYDKYHKLTNSKDETIELTFEHV